MKACEQKFQPVKVLKKLAFAAELCINARAKPWDLTVSINWFQGGSRRNKRFRETSFDITPLLFRSDIFDKMNKMMDKNNSTF